MGKCIATDMCSCKSPLPLCFASASNLSPPLLIYSFFFFFPPSPPHFSPRVQSISSAFLFFSASPGWETGHSCRGTASLSRVALSRPPPKHTATSYPGNRLSFLTTPTVVWRKWQQRTSSGQYSPVTPPKGRFDF